MPAQTHFGHHLHAVPIASGMRDQMLFLALSCSACAEIGYASTFCFSCKVGFAPAKLSFGQFQRKYDSWKAATSSTDKSIEAFRASPLYAKNKSPASQPAAPELWYARLATDQSIVPAAHARLAPYLKGRPSLNRLGPPPVSSPDPDPRPCPTPSPRLQCPLTRTRAPVAPAMSATPQAPLEFPSCRLRLLRGSPLPSVPSSLSLAATCLPCPPGTLLALLVPRARPLTPLPSASARSLLPVLHSPVLSRTVPIPAQIVLDHHVLAYSAFAASTAVPAYPVSRSSMLAYLRYASLLPLWSSRAASGVLTAFRRSCRLQNLPWLSIGAARALRAFSAPSPPPPPPPFAPMSRSWTSHPEPWVELTILDYDRATGRESVRDIAVPSPDVAHSSPRRSCAPSPPSSSPIANGLVATVSARLSLPVAAQFALSRRRVSRRRYQLAHVSGRPRGSPVP